MTSGWQGAPYVFQKIRPGVGFKTGDFVEERSGEGAIVKIRPRKACNYPNSRSDGWVSYDKVGVLYSGKLGSRSEPRASDLRNYPELWWKRIKLHLYEGTKVSTLRGPAQLADLQGALCVPTYNFTLS